MKLEELLRNFQGPRVRSWPISQLAKSSIAASSCASDFKAGKARYEINDDHNHLIDIKTGEIIEFVDNEIEELQKKVAEKYGYDLVDHKLELYGIKKKN